MSERTESRSLSLITKPNVDAMFNINNLVQKAQSLIDPTLSPTSTSVDRKPSKGSLFRHQFRLPDSESPLHEITAELTVPLPYKSQTSHEAPGEKRTSLQGNIYAGKLHLSENFLCFSTQATSFQAGTSLQISSAFTGHTHGAGPAGNGFTLPLCAIRKVERLPTQNALFALAITTWGGSANAGKDHNPREDMQRFTLQFAGSRQACDRFCDGLKKGLRSGVKQVESLRIVVGDCYSEHLLSAINSKSKDSLKTPDGSRDPPDAGLGMVFRYPGDPRKLRDRSKMRLWGEYFRGWTCTLLFMWSLKLGQITGEMLQSSASLHSTSSYASDYPTDFAAKSGKSPRVRSSFACGIHTFTLKPCRSLPGATLLPSTRLKRISTEAYQSMLVSRVRRASVASGASSLLTAGQTRRSDTVRQ